MGLGDWFSDALSGLGGIARKVGSTIAQEATDFTGALVGSAYGALTGKEVEIPALAGLSTAPEAFGGALGTAIGGGVERAIVERAVQAGPAGSSGVESNPRTRPQGGVEDLLSRWGITGINPEANVKATALPGGAPVHAGIGSEILDLAVGAAQAIGGFEGIIPEIGAALGLREGGTQMANGRSLTLPGADPGKIYRVRGPRLVPRREFFILNPSTGNLDWFKPAGRPLLWSGDLSACKRVDRLARRARRYSRKR